MATTVTITYPVPGGWVPPVVAAGTFHMSGTYTLDNQPIQKIVCRVVYPAAAGSPAIVYEQNADRASGLTWEVVFAALPPGLDTCMQAEIFVQTIATRQDFDTVEDVDVLAPPAINMPPIVGTINPPAPLPLPIPLIP